MERLLDAGSVDVVGDLSALQPRDRLQQPRRRRAEEYLARWLRSRAWGKRALAPGGSFFLNVGGKPTDPYVPFDVLSVMRRHFSLQNVIHWVKSVAILRSEVGDYPGLEAGPGGGRLQADQQRALRKRLPGVHLPPDALRRRPAGPPGGRRALPRQVERLPVGGWRDVHCRGNTWFLPNPYDRAA